MTPRLSLAGGAVTQRRQSSLPAGEHFTTERGELLLRERGELTVQSILEWHSFYGHGGFLGIH
jgi:hypothetical protein